MTPELDRGREMVRESSRATQALLATSLLLLGLLGAAYANLWMRQSDLEDGIREDALWAVYQMGREARTLLEAIETSDRDVGDDRSAREGLVLRYDILYSRLSILETTKYGASFTGDPDIEAGRARLRELIGGMEPAIAALGAPSAHARDAVALQGRVAELVTVAEDLLARTNSAVSAARADARAEVMRLQKATAWIVLALALSTALLVASLVRRLRATKAASDQIQVVADQLASAFEAAEAGNRAKSEFMAVMGHEIRTPLNAILGMAEILSLSRLEERETGCVRAIGASGTALLETINEILDYAKIEHGDAPPESIAFDPADVARQAIGIVEGRARERGNAITFLATDVGDWFLGDPTRLRRVLLNLLSNAVKFTENGSIRVALRDVGSPGCPRLRFLVSDSGIGIDEASRPLLFRAFSQVDGSIGRRFGGTGLGLAICKRVVEAMGGTIGVDSEPGVGSRFWFEVPARHAHRQVPVAVPPANPALPLRELDILVVEDNAFNREVAGRLLAILGQEDVTFAEDGEAAVRLCADHRFDLILMDMQMPVLDGIEATRRIRASDGPSAGTPIVALTANASDDDRRRCVDVGMSGFEAKPVALERLRKLVADWGAATGGAAAATVTQSTRAATTHAGIDIDETRVAELTFAIGADGVEELREAFFADASQLLSDLSSAMRENDPDRTDRALHTIKGAAANIGYVGLAAFAEALRREPVEIIPVEALAREFERLEAASSPSRSAA